MPDVDKYTAQTTMPENVQKLTQQIVTQGYIHQMGQGVEEKPFSFFARIGSILQRYILRSNIIFQSEAKRKKHLDLHIGLTLIGQRGREQLLERMRKKERLES